MPNATAHAPADLVAPLVLTIDIGTSSVRTLVYDARGQAVPGVGGHEPYTVRAAADGRSEDDADDAIARVARCVDAALSQAGALAAHIGAVAVDTLVSNILAIDASGRPLTPLITYADTRNADDAAALRRELDERAVHQRTGCMLRTSYWPARLAWFKRTQPATWRSAARWITLGEYLELQLFGQCRASYSAASWGGLLGRASLEWDAPLLAHLRLGAGQLSPLVGADAPLRGLTGRDAQGRAYAERWPALRGVPWFAAIGDGAAANIGSGATSEGRVALTVGTTGALRVVLQEGRPAATPVPDGLWCYRVDARRALLGGATSEGGNVYAWLRQTLRLGEPEQIEAQWSKLPPDGHGLTVLPFVAGERSPGWAGDVRATIHGLGLSTAPFEILRASLEAVAYRFAIIFGGLEASQASQPHRSEAQLIASGGALLGSPAWMQLIADVLGRPLVASAEHEATSRGAALLALEALGAVASVDDLPASTGARYQPDPANHAAYQAAIARQQELYRQFYG